MLCYFARYGFLSETKRVKTATSFRHGIYQIEISEQTETTANDDAAATNCILPFFSPSLQFGSD